MVLSAHSWSRRGLAALLVSCSLTGCGGAAPAPQPAATPAASTTAKVAKVAKAWPETRRGDVVDTLHGVAVPDPYRWLEDPDSPETRTWIGAQNAAAARHLATIPAVGQLRKRLEAAWSFDRRAAPEIVAGTAFQLRQSGLQNQPQLFVGKDDRDAGRVLLDPNTLAADGTVALKHAEVSPDGRHVAWMTSAAGSDWSEIRVREVATGKDRPDHLHWVKFSGISWSKDGKGFYYTAYDAPKEGEALRAKNEYHKLYYHRLGSAQADDVLVRESREHADWGFGGDVSHDGRLLYVPIWRGATKKNALVVGRIGKAGGRPTAWIEIDSSFELAIDIVGNVGDRLLVRTDKGAPRGQVMAIDLKRPAPADWQVVVAEHATDTLRDARIVGGRLVLLYLDNAHSRLAAHTLDGKPAGTIALPGVGTVAELSGDADDAHLYFRYTSFNWPVSLWKVTMKTLAVEKLWAPELPFSPEDFVTEQHFAKSKDGTRVPYFVVRRKDVALDAPRPVWLHAYGGFDIPMVPAFSVDRLVWAQTGALFVLANLRGGGEFGEAWHKGGMLGNKQNVFDDFFAVAEDLHRKGWASPETTAIAGGSNGGLLVGAAITQRPELYRAALPAVGVMDMLRYHRWTIGWAWVPEYGSADDPAAFRWLKAYSPLHNCRPQRYPATLVTTADHDDRVVPAHSFKFAAALQHAQQGDAPVLIRIEEKAGHGAGKPTSKRIDEAADKLGFLVGAIGAERFPHLGKD